MNSPKYMITYLLLFSLSVTACKTNRNNFQTDRQQPEAISLLGKPLYQPQFSEERQRQLEVDLSRAKLEYEKNPEDPDRIIWLGRRTAYLGRYREAIDIYTEGIKKHPNYAKLYRHRGHRYITVRELDKAIADLEKAAELIRGVPDEIEPDGMPNKYNIPTSTSHTNIWYHLGLAYYLKGGFQNAERCYIECLKFSKNDDMLCAASDWLYMTYRRLGKTEEAKKVLERIHRDMTILEDTAYHNRLLMYKGEIAPESLLSLDKADDLIIATYGYGVGNWYYDNGKEDKAIKIFKDVVNGTNWAAFGYIAAEVELKRFLR
ncbi:MAG: hypothetical protein HY707_13905 [Ignavibacteriae bacterium]|nr:hypothetical protein [Ignavibacteriota bacterium]